jgi:hypothetical protein
MYIVDFFVAILPSQHPPQRWHETTRYGFYFMPGVRPPTNTYVVDTRAGVDASITIFCDFNQFSAKMAFLLKTKVIIHFLQNSSGFCGQCANFVAEFLAKLL